MSRLFAILTLLLALPATAQSVQPLVEKITLRDTIQPITAARIDRAIQQAESDRAQALLIDLDTPGGLLDSTRQIVGSILASRVPVIVFIAPDGARAGSAGFFLLEAADIAAMAPGTNAGASHPVLAAGTPDDTMKQKMENDAAAFLRSFTTTRGRNVQLAETAVRSSVSWSASEALANHLIDLTATGDRDLLSQIDGRAISHNGSSITLHTRNARIELIEPTLRERVLSRLANPNLALLLLFAGVLLVYLEFNVPGTIIPGALGTVLILTAIFALDLLPIRHTALLLLLSAFTLIVLELKFPSHGILTAAGIVALALGTLTLIDAPIPELRIQPVIAIALCTCFGVLTAFLLRLAIRARRQKVLTGPAALVGSHGTTLEPVSIPGTHSPGHILVQGEIWEATATTAISVKESVRVTGHHGDILEVEPQP
jgi:membrane-bound serine protease (ClpP class)